MNKADRFWSKIEKTDTCWNWTKFTRRDGYGYLRVGDEYVSAHRYAYSLSLGPIPEGMLVDHICHNKRCVRPEHLRLANHATNAQNRSGANSNSRTGVRGVFQRPGQPGFITQVWHRGKQYSAGTHKTLEAAEAAVIALRLELFTHNTEDRAA